MGYLPGRFEALGPESAAALNRFVYCSRCHLRSSSSRPGRQSERFSMAFYRRLRRWISCDAPHFTVDWTDLVSARSGNAERAGAHRHIRKRCRHGIATLDDGLRAGRSLAGNPRRTHHQCDVHRWRDYGPRRHTCHRIVSAPGDLVLREDACTQPFISAPLLGIIFSTLALSLPGQQFP